MLGRDGAFEGTVVRPPSRALPPPLPTPLLPPLSLLFSLPLLELGLALGRPSGRAAERGGGRRSGRRRGTFLRLLCERAKRRGGGGGGSDGRHLDALDVAALLSAAPLNAAAVVVITANAVVQSNDAADKIAEKGVSLSPLR